TVRLWDVPTGREVRTLGKTAAAVCAVAYSPDGRWVAAGTAGAGDGHAGLLGEVKVWDEATGGPVRSIDRPGSGWGLAFCPDGKRVVSASYDGTAKVWDLGTGDEPITLRGHEGRVMATAFSPDGWRLATASSDHTAKLWDAHAGHEVVHLDGHTNPVMALAF